MAREQGIVFDVRTNIEEIVKELGALQRDIPFMTAYALTNTAKDIHKQQQQAMQQVFDRPTRFALNAQYVKPAKKDDLTAGVLMKDGWGSIEAWRYLGPQIEGGPRKKKSHERALERAGFLLPNEYVVPSSAVPLDAHGNMKGGEITRLLSQLGASRDATQNMTRRSRKRAISRAGGRFFVMARDRRAPPGVYLRINARDAIPWLMFVTPPNYTRRYPFYETAQIAFDQNFDRHFRVAWLRYVSARPSRQAA